MKHKVRPFAKRFDLLDINALAEVRDGRFLLKIGKFEHAIPAMDTGSDEFGEYAFILDQRVDLGFGCWLFVEPEYDETDALLDLDPGCRVRFEEPADDIIQQMGVDPQVRELQN